MTDPDPPGFDIEDFLLYRLAMLSRRLSDALEAHYGPRHGLQRAQWRVLALIGTSPQCKASELVRRASLDAVAVHRAVGQLVERGLVLRRPSPQDGRVKLLRLSTEGRRVLADTVPVALALEQRVLAALPAAEARALLRALRRLQRHEWLADTQQA